MCTCIARRDFAFVFRLFFCYFVGVCCVAVRPLSSPYSISSFHSRSRFSRTQQQHQLYQPFPYLSLCFFSSHKVVSLFPARGKSVPSSLLSLWYFPSTLSFRCCCSNRPITQNMHTYYLFIFTFKLSFLSSLCAFPLPASSSL